MAATRTGAATNTPLNTLAQAITTLLTSSRLPMSASISMPYTTMQAITNTNSQADMNEHTMPIVRVIGCISVEQFQHYMIIHENTSSLPHNAACHNNTSTVDDFH
jgi:hypothetical protein